MTRVPPVPLLTAVTDSAWEAALVAELGRGVPGLTVVRRCVDLADLLAVAASGVARAAVVSADLRRLDGEALARLGSCGVAVIGVVRPGEEDAERRLRQLGVRSVLDTAASPAQVGRAIADVLAAAAGDDPPSPGSQTWGGSRRRGTRRKPRPGAVRPRDGREPATDPARQPAPPGATAPAPGDGRVVAVWGPTGAPGRTSVAVGLAAELAAAGHAPLLVDADVYGGTIAQVLGLLEETPGLAAACRLANTGTLDLPRLAGLAREVHSGLRVLPGIARPARWPELRASALEAVLSVCRLLAPVTVVDCGFSLEQDEELMYDVAAPRRNAATLVALQSADAVLAVGAADPVGVQRLVRGLSELADVVPGVEPLIVVNRTRRASVGGEPSREVGAALERYAGVTVAAYVPHDLPAFDAAVAAGRTLVEVAPSAPARRALRALADDLADRLLPGGSRAEPTAGTVRSAGGSRSRWRRPRSA